MSFRLVSKSVTLNDLERRNGDFGSFQHALRKRVEDICKLSATESPKLLVLAIYYLWRYSQWISPSEGVKARNSLLLGDIRAE